MGTKNVYFYAMYLIEDEKPIDHTNIKTIFDEVFNSTGVKVFGGIKSIEIESPSSKIYIDKKWENDNYLYGSIGRIKENNSIQIRDFVTCETSDVLDSSLIDKRGLEVFTYFLMDYKTGIVCAVKNLGAPSIRTLCEIIKKKGEEYDAVTKPIFNIGPEKIEKLMKCDILYSIDMSHAIPDPSVLGPMGMGTKEILKLTKAGVGKSYARTIIRGGMRKALLKGNSKIKNVVKSFIDNIQDYDKLIVHAKIEGEEEDGYNLVEQFAKEKIKISDSTERAVLSDELKLCFIDVYEQNKERLKLNCGR